MPAPDFYSVRSGYVLNDYKCMEEPVFFFPYGYTLLSVSVPCFTVASMLVSVVTSHV